MRKTRKTGSKRRVPRPVFRPYLYLAYGSNLNLEQFSRRCPSAEQVSSGLMAGHRLVFRGVADMIAQRGSEVPIALYRITAACEKALDRYEGFPNLYYKKMLTISINGVVDDAMYYKMNSTNIAAPNGYYYDTIESGYYDWQLPLSFLEQARLEAEEIEEAAWRKVRSLPTDQDEWNDDAA